MIILLSGSSGSGKNTVINALKSEENSVFTSFPSYTTREKRPGEKDGDLYVYVTAEEFAEKIMAGDLYEYQPVHGELYGTSRKLVDAAMQKSKYVIKDIDVKGMVNLKRELSFRYHVVSVFLYVGKEELKKRLIGRGEKPESIEHRMLRYEEELADADKFDYRIDNVILEETLARIKEIAEKESV